MAPRPRRELRRATASLLAVIACLALVPTAAAHAEYLGSSPTKGARLDAAPAEVWVHLTERVDPSVTTLTVRDGDGRRWDNDDLVVEDSAQPILRVTLENDTPDGAYLVRWSTISTID